MGALAAAPPVLAQSTDDGRITHAISFTCVPPLQLPQCGLFDVDGDHWKLDKRLAQGGRLGGSFDAGCRRPR